MAKATFQSRVNAAVVAYTKGSRKLVELFEEAATRYWNEDSRTVDNLQFFLNALKAFPVLQKAAVESTLTFGKFDIQLEEGVVLMKNKKVKEEQRAQFIEIIEAYKAKQYNSLLAAHNNKLMKAFDLDQRLKGFANSATSIIVNAMAEEKGTQEEIIARLEADLTALRTVDFSDKIQARKDELAELKAKDAEAAESVAAPANEETPVNSENAA